MKNRTVHSGFSGLKQEQFSDITLLHYNLSNMIKKGCHLPLYHCYMSTTQFDPHLPKCSVLIPTTAHRLSLFHLSCLIHPVKLPPRAAKWETMGITSCENFNLRKSDITMQLFLYAHMCMSYAHTDTAESTILLMLKITPKTTNWLL